MTAGLKQAPMRIATWNLERVRPGNGVRAQRITHAIESIGASVWVLTETNAGFSPGKGFKRITSSSPAPDRNDDEHWVAVWVRNEYEATPLPLKGDPERTAAARLKCSNGTHVAIFGTVLPWRSDNRREVRGASAFEAALTSQMADIDELRQRYPDDLLCIAGDLNQEIGNDTTVGTKRGAAALEQAMYSRKLVSLTGGADDPLMRRNWRASIDHVLACDRLAPLLHAEPKIWPDQCPLPRGFPDHYGVALGFWINRAP